MRTYPLPHRIWMWHFPCCFLGLLCRKGRQKCIRRWLCSFIIDSCGQHGRNVFYRQDIYTSPHWKWIIHIYIYIYIYIYICVHILAVGTGTQGFVLARQVLCHLSHTLSPFAFSVCSNRTKITSAENQVWLHGGEGVSAGDWRELSQFNLSCVIFTTSDTGSSLHGKFWRKCLDTARASTYLVG
jgi:hypothetical protein